MVSTHIKNISQNGSSPQVGMKNKKSNHQLEYKSLIQACLYCSPSGWPSANHPGATRLEIHIFEMCTAATPYQTATIATTATTTTTTTTTTQQQQVQQLTTSNSNNNDNR